MNQPASLILTYHSLDASGSPISLPPETFAQHMQWLASAQIPVVPLTAITESRGAVAITFDDGFHNFREHAFPILHELLFPATVFIVTGYCGKTNRWPAQPASIPSLDLLSWTEIGELARHGVDFGGHSVNHPDLTRIERGAASAEIRECRTQLEDHLGRAIESFAWPYGSSNHDLRMEVAEKFILGCGTDLRFLERNYERANLPRIDAYYVARAFWFKNQRSRWGKAYLSLRRILRQGRSFLKTDSPGNAVVTSR